MTPAAELLRRAGSLATLPALYLRLRDVANDPRSSLEDVGGVLLQDTALTARLLRLVNSAAFRSVGPVETVADAVRVVGPTEILDLTLTSTLLAHFQGVPGAWVDMQSFWRHSLACAFTARHLARRRGEGAERLFTAGVLHDIGRLLLYLTEPERMRRMLLQARLRGTTLEEAEREEMGYDHADLGRVLLASWNLPASLQEIVGCHHRPEEAARHPREAAILQVADALVNALQLGTSGERLVPPLRPATWDAAGVRAEDLGPMLEDVVRRYADAVQIVLLYQE